MKTKTLLLLAIAWLLIIGTNCRKEKPTYNMPQEFKDYVMFPEGSYWIYEDSITGVIDTLSIIKQQLDFITDHRDCSCNYERLINEFYSTHINSVIFKFTEPNFDINFHYIYYIGRPWDMRYLELYYPFNETNNQSFSHYFNYSYFGNLIINNIQYYGVRVFINSLSNNDYSELYYCKGIGIIKKKIITPNNDTIVWELKNYHIN